MTAEIAAAVGKLTTREARLEDALRHARGIVASEIRDRRRYIQDWQRKELRNPTLTVEAAAQRERRLLAQIDERERWIAAWDAALAPEARS